MQIGAEVYLWGTRIGMIIQSDIAAPPQFTYDRNFVKSSIELSPVTMPLSLQTYSFPELRENTFRGLPGLLADEILTDRQNFKISADERAMEQLWLLLLALEVWRDTKQQG